MFVSVFDFWKLPCKLFIILNVIIYIYCYTYLKHRNNRAQGTVYWCVAWIFSQNAHTGKSVKSKYTLMVTLCRNMYVYWEITRHNFKKNCPISPVHSIPVLIHCSSRSPRSAISTQDAVIFVRNTLWFRSF